MSKHGTAVAAETPTDGVQTRERPPRGGLTRTLKDLVLTVPVLPITILVYLVLGITTPGFATFGNLQNLLGSMAVLAIAAIGATIVFLVAGIDLSVGSTIALSSVVGAIVTRDTGSMVAGLAAAVGVGFLVGIINGFSIGTFGLPPFVFTLGVLLAARAIAYMAAAAAAGGGGTAASVGQLPPQVLAFGQSTFAAIPSAFWIAFVLVAVFSVLLSATAFGRRFYFAGSNELAARFNGLHVAATKIFAYTIAGTLGGVAGFVLLTRLGSGNATVGDVLLLQVIAATVIGGTSLFGGQGGVWRTLVGVFLISGLTNALGLLGMPSWYQEIIVGIVVIFGSGLAVFLSRFHGRRTH
jgi:ribose/xylose/arabinose/galactoside ABC-type transport system permease subunit